MPVGARLLAYGRMQLRDDRRCSYELRDGGVRDSRRRRDSVCLYIKFCKQKSVY